DAAIAAIRNNRPGSGNGADALLTAPDKASALRAHAQAKAAADTFNRELAEANARLNTPTGAVRKAAAGGVCAWIEQRADELRRLDQAAARLRSQLRAATEIWEGGGPLPVNHTMARYIADDPFTAEVAGPIERQ